MQFLLNDTPVKEKNAPADLTLLRYLREQRQLVGTKEGCASGDCGACTVLVGELRDNKVQYLSVNACIAPLGMVANKHVVTVEYLSKAGKLHPSQAAMVECHGSQCGFCTPGFVMSLAGLYQNSLTGPQGGIGRAQVYDAISGNLCRCTGYRPIVDAGLSMAETYSDEFRLDTSDLVEILATMQSEKDDGPYYRPHSLADLDQCYAAEPEARLLAGGTDLALEITQHYRHLDKIIDISQVAELTTIAIVGEKIVIGGAVTYAQLEDFFAESSPQFNALLERIGSRQIRNRGTLGGNIANASPIADLPPWLLSLDADMTLRKVSGTTRTLALDDFYLDYKSTVMADDEYIQSLSFDKKFLGQFHRYYKISKRIEDDISSVMAAFRFELKDKTIATARIAFGGMAAVPARAKAAEKLLTGAAIDDSTALDAAVDAITRDFNPLSDVRASAAYRLKMATNLLHKAWLELNGTTLPSLTQGQAHA